MSIGHTLHYSLDQTHVKECEAMVELVDKGWNSKTTIREMYKSMWTILYEIIWYQKYSDEVCREKIHNLDAFIEYCDEIAKDKGLIITTCHLGNWELCSRIISRYYRPISSAYKPHKKEWVNQLILSSRNQHNQTTISKEGGLLPLIRALKKKECIGLIIDQHGGKNGVDSEFLDKPCKSWDSVIQMAYRTQCPIIPVTFIRKVDGFHAHFIKDFQLVLDENRKLDIQKSVVKLDQALSDLVCLAPEQWLWLGRRWSRDFKTMMASS